MSDICLFMSDICVNARYMLILNFCSCGTGNYLSGEDGSFYNFIFLNTKALYSHDPFVQEVRPLYYLRIMPALKI